MLSSEKVSDKDNPQVFVCSVVTQTYQGVFNVSTKDEE
jgi:hypothetical protein